MSQSQILVCLATEDGDAVVPSDTWSCSSCYQDVWVSHAMVPTAEQCFVMCELCSVSVAEEMGAGYEVEFAEGQREELKQMWNVNDAQLDEIIAEYNKSLRKRHANGDQERGGNERQ